MTGVSVSEYLEKVNIELQEKEKLLSVIVDERNSISKKIDLLIEMRMNNELSKDLFSEKHKPLELRQSQLNNQLPELQAEIDFLKIQTRSSDVVLQDATDLYTQWGSLSDEDKRTIVETITERITVGKEDIHIKLAYLPANKPTHTADPTRNNNLSPIQNPVKRQSNV